MKQPTSPIYKNLIQATRPRTFPLAFASIACGNALAYQTLGSFSFKNWLIFILTTWVALSLQILSNLANDYGDGIKGTDQHRHNTSPTRLTAQGKLNPKIFKKIIITWAWLTFFFGITLIYLSLNSLIQLLTFLTFGIIAIISAMAYTMGKRPYGYRAMGEIAVLIFFGWLGVLGSIYLQTHYLTSTMLLPATGCGLLSACVLYLNNMRDIDSDHQANKITLAILLTKKHMLKGYYILLALAVLAYIAFAYQQFQLIGAIITLIGLSLLLKKHIQFLSQHPQEPIKIGTQLKITVLNTLIINLIFSLIMILNVLWN